MKRKIPVGFFVVLLAVGMLTSTVIGQSGPMVTVRVGGQARTYEYVFAAKDWARPYNIAVVMHFLASAAEPAQMLIASQTDVGFISPERLVPMVAREPGKYFVVGVTSYGSSRHALVVKTDSPYQSIEDLRGKKLAARIGSGNWKVFQRYLKNRNVALKDFQIVNMDPANMAAALQAGVIDGMLAWEPFVSSAAVSGLGRVVVRFENLGLLSNSIVTTRQYARYNPGTLTKFLAAWYDAAQLMEKDPATAGSLAAAFETKKTGVQVDPRIHEFALKYVGTDPMYIVTHTPEFYEELKETAAEMVQARQLSAVPDFAGLFDVTYLKKAVDLSKTTKK